MSRRFRRMGKQSWLMGPECKNATDAKMALQIMMGGQAALLAECLAFCERRRGRKSLVRRVGQRRHDEPSLKIRRQPNVRRRRKQSPVAANAFQTYLQQDLKLAIETAEKVNCEVPIKLPSTKMRQSERRKKAAAYEDFAGVRDAYDEKSTP